MFKNLLILLVSTFIIGAVLKFYLFTIEPPPPPPPPDFPVITLEVADSLFFYYENDVFDSILVHYLYKFEGILLSSKTKYDSQISKDFSLGLLYFSRYKEFIAARNLLSELNHNLYFEPRSDKHKEKIPMLTNFINSDLKLEKFSMEPSK